MTKISLTPTSALVSLWSGTDLFQSKASHDYFNLLDLSSGTKMSQEYEHIWPYYGKAIRYRKYAVYKFCRDILGGDSQINQVIILAAGYDPLSVELKSCFKDILIFDLDRDGMPLKQSLIKQVDPSLDIRCISEDLSNPDKITQKLKENGFDFGAPTLIVAEGISYYMSIDSLWQAIFLFKNQKKNKLVFEYCIPSEDVSADFSYIPKKVFDSLAQDFGLGECVFYTDQILSEQFEKVGGELEQVLDMKQIEEISQQEDRLFPNYEDGWLRVSLGAL